LVFFMLLRLLRNLVHKKAALTMRFLRQPGCLFKDPLFSAPPFPEGLAFSG